VGRALIVDPLLIKRVSYSAREPPPALASVFSCAPNVAELVALSAAFKTFRDESHAAQSARRIGPACSYAGDGGRLQTSAQGPYVEADDGRIDAM